MSKLEEGSEEWKRSFDQLVAVTGLSQQEASNIIGKLALQNPRAADVPFVNEALKMLSEKDIELAKEA